MSHRNSATINLGQRRQSKGQAIIEYLGYIALVALALGGLVFFLLKGRQNTTVQNEATAFLDMSSAAQKLYSSDPAGYADITVDSLIDNGIVDPKRVVNGGLISKFGTPIAVAAATLYSAGDGASYTYGVPPAQCSAFAQSVSSGVAKLSVAGTTVLDTTAGTALAPAALGTACNSTGGGNVPMILTVSR